MEENPVVVIPLPKHLRDIDEDAIYNRMIKNFSEKLEDDYEISIEGDKFINDLFKAVAKEKVELVERVKETLRLMFPIYAYDEWLDLHGEVRGLGRKNGKSNGKLEIENEDDFKNIKEKLDKKESVVFIEDKTGFTFTAVGWEEEKPSEGKPNVIIAEANDYGEECNFKKGTIFTSNGIKAAAYANFEGGFIEADKDYRERIQKYDKFQDISFIGNPYDYERWATEEVTEVKSVIIEKPKLRTVPSVCDKQLGICYDREVGDGVVIIYLLKNNNTEDIVFDKENETYIESEVKLIDLIKEIKEKKEKKESIDKNFSYYQAMVYDNIMSPLDKSNRNAPPGAKIKIMYIKQLEIKIKATVDIDKNSDVVIDDIMDEFEKALEAYIPEAKARGVVLYSKVAAILSNIEGVYDFRDMTLEVGEEKLTKIPVDNDEMPKFKIDDGESTS